MKLNGTIQIIGGNPGENKVLTCTDIVGNCQWIEIPKTNSGDVIMSGVLQNNTLVLNKTSGTEILIDLSSLSSGEPVTGVGDDTYVVKGEYDLLTKSINLRLNDNSIVSIPFAPIDNNNFIVSGRIDGNDLILTDNDGIDRATIDISTLVGGSDKYLNTVTLPSDGPNANQLTLTLNDNSTLSVDVSHLVNDNNTALRKFGKDKVTNNVTITTTSNSQTVRVVHDLGRFYPVFTVYHINRNKVILPESVGMVNSTGMIPANAVTGPHELNELDMTFTEPGTYIISFVG